MILYKVFQCLKTCSFYIQIGKTSKDVYFERLSQLFVEEFWINVTQRKEVRSVNREKTKTTIKI